MWRLSVFVTKADGSRQLFDRGKVVRTCLRMGASREIAEEVAGRVERSVYDGVSTSKVLQLTVRLLRGYRPAIRHFLDLRRGLSLMDSKPEFEVYSSDLESIRLKPLRKSKKCRIAGL